MTKEQLHGAMSLIDDKYIAESMTEYKPKMPLWVKRSIATAAVLVLVIAVTLGGAALISPPTKDSAYGDALQENMGGKPGEPQIMSVGIGRGEGGVSVSFDESEDGILTFTVKGDVGRIGILALYNADGVPSYSAYNFDVAVENAEWVSAHYSALPELLTASTAVKGDGEETTLTVDITGALATADDIIEFYLYICGSAYELVP